MKVYLASDGSILQSTPSVVGRGSTVTDFEVEAPFPAAVVQVRFGLRAGTTDPLALTRLPNASGKGYNVWYGKLKYAVTQFSGTVTYTIEIIDADGYTIAAPQGTLTISKGAPPTLPDKPPEDSWRDMLRYLAQIIGDSDEIKADLAKLEAEFEARLTYVQNAIGRLAAFSVDDDGHYVVETIEYDNLQQFMFTVNKHGNLCVSYQT